MNICAGSGRNMHYDTMEIPRDAYLKKLILRKHNGFIKIITGIRRCGKSYLLNNLFYQHLLSSGVAEDHIIRFAFDSADDLERIGESIEDIGDPNAGVSPKKFMAYIASKITDANQYYLLLDEVQRLKNFELVLISYLRKNNLDVYVTGSNSRFLSSDIITEFAGRGDEIHVLPLVFSEFFSVSETSPGRAFDEYLVYGGLPQTVLLKTDEQKAAFLETQMKNVYLRDIVQRHNLHSDSDLSELLMILASSVACPTNPRRLSATFSSEKKSSITANTVNNYIAHLEDAFIVKKSLKYDVRGNSYINTPFKLYFEDTGLRNACLHFRQSEPPYLMENIIFNELRYRGFSVDTGIVPVRESDSSGKEVRKQLEIDFVANKGSRRYYIQSAWSIPDRDKYLQETHSYRKTPDSFKKIIIVSGSLKPRRDENGYVTMGVLDFLLNPDSLDF
ncbi:MAG TPA: ATP-binding protein [Methanocorpusculum sp.]|nr:ATP-binding protein [Methanocorpusculum sp.]